MGSKFQTAIAELIAERGLPRELVVETVGKALLDVYHRTVSSTDDVQVLVDKTGEVHMLRDKRVVAQVQDPTTEISLADAQRLKPHAALGETMAIEMPELLEKIPVRNAGQIILQRIREAEQTYVMESFKDRLDEITVGTILRRDNDGSFVLEVGKLEGILPLKEQVPSERYKTGQRLRVYVVEMKRTGGRTPQVIVSRAHPNMIKRLFEQEVPEIVDGTVELKGFVREPGSRSKVAVWARQEGVDPIGACVGVRGSRINNIVNELNGEKIDIIPWSPDPATFISNALSPAKPLGVELREADHTALVTVPERQLSLAIGKEGQNARLAAKLTTWRIDVHKPAEPEPAKAPLPAEMERGKDGEPSGI
jgi:N utilization substance protein A